MDTCNKRGKAAAERQNENPLFGATCCAGLDPNLETCHSEALSVKQAPGCLRAQLWLPSPQSQRAAAAPSQVPRCLLSAIGAAVLLKALPLAGAGCWGSWQLCVCCCWRGQGRLWASRRHQLLEENLFHGELGDYILLSQHNLA